MADKQKKCVQSTISFAKVAKLSNNSTDTSSTTESTCEEKSTEAIIDKNTVNNEETGGTSSGSSSTKTFPTTKSSKDEDDLKSEGKEKRFYNKTWEKMYTWLYEDKMRGGGFCKLCENYMKNNAKVFQQTGGIFITNPFTSYKNALGKGGKLEKHEHSASHTTSVEMEMLKISALKRPIHQQLLVESEEQKNINRNSLALLIRSAYFLIKEEIAHTTKYESLISNVVAKCTSDFENWVKMQSERSTYCSKNTVCELLECIGQVLNLRTEKKLLNKKFSLMADESTSLNNDTVLSICVRYVDNGVAVETFVSIIKIANGLSETIASAIDEELKKRKLSYANLVAFGFDGASNFSGNTAGVRRKLSQKAGRDIPYIHCRAHVLSLAAASCRNANPKVKRFFYTLKDIYKLFSKSPKRENILHEIQSVINDPILKVPECIEVRWLSHYRIVNAVKRSYRSIVIACEHIHKDGADLASLAGGILLEMRNQSFYITLTIMNEILCALSNLSLMLQNASVCFASLITLVQTTKDHLKSIAEKCHNQNSEEDLLKCLSNFNDCLPKTSDSIFNSLTEDEKACETCKQMEKYINCVVDEISNRFHDQAINIMKGAACFENFTAFMNTTEDDIISLCDIFTGIDGNLVVADFKSFRFFYK